MNTEIFSSLFEALKKEVGIEEDYPEISGGYVNAVEIAKLLVCWRLLEILKRKLP
jgi:phosphoribulokinase